MNSKDKGVKEDQIDQASSINEDSDIVESSETETDSGIKLANIPDILQEVHQEIIIDLKIKKDELINPKVVGKSLHNIIRGPSTYRSRMSVPSKNLLGAPISKATVHSTRSRSGGILIAKQKPIPISLQNRSRETVTTKSSENEPISTQSSIQNSERETISSQSSNQISELEPISNGTSVQNSEPGIISNQISLSYDASELEPVSLYSFHAARNSRNRFEVEIKPTSTVHQPISMCSVGSVVCRICHNAEEPERLISPCLCKGTLAYVHKNCLEHWLRTSGMVSCELCHYRFKVRASLRYTFLQSLRLWYSHPNNRGLLQADFLVCSLLTVVSFGLVGISMMALQHFVLQGRRYGVSRFWTQICILMFLSVISFVYSINMFLILKSQLVPWYTWWQSAKDVTLILENRKSDIALTRLKEKQKHTEEIELESMILSREREARQQISVLSPTQPQPAQTSPTPPPTSQLPPSLNGGTSHNSRTNEMIV